MATKLKGFTQVESDYIAHEVESLREDVWAQYPVGTKDAVFNYCTDLRNFGMMAGAEVCRSVEERFRVPSRHANVMVGAWRTYTRKEAE